MKHSIKVVGEAKVSAAPDRVRIIINIGNISKEYHEAMSTAEKSEAEMADTVEKAGFLKTDLKTLSWNITTEYEYVINEKNEQVKVFAGYRYKHSFEVELGIDHQAIGRILQGLIQSSLTPEISLEYFVSELQEYKDKLLHQAVEDSRHKAAIMAEAGDARLGSVISMKYKNGYQHMVRGMDNHVAVPMMAKGTFRLPDITPVDIELSEHVLVVWELQLQL